MKNDKKSKDDVSGPVPPGRPREFAERADLPEEAAGYEIIRRDPGFVNRVTSAVNGTDPHRRYVGISSNVKQRLSQHEAEGKYDPEQDTVRVYSLREQAKWAQLRAWEQDRIAEKHPVLNDPNHPGGQGRTPDAYADDLPDCEECGDDEDVEGPDEDGDFWCNYCDEYLDEYGVVIDYDDDEED